MKVGLDIGGTKIAAVGVFHLLNDPHMHAMAYVNLGTELAAGLVLEGRLWRGSRRTTGEINHVDEAATTRFSNADYYRHAWNHRLDVVLH